MNHQNFLRFKIAVTAHDGVHNHEIVAESRYAAKVKIRRQYGAGITIRFLEESAVDGKPEGIRKEIVGVSADDLEDG
jgi:hypothetical protein